MRRGMLLWPGALLALMALSACENDRGRVVQEPPVTSPAVPGATTVVPGAKVDAIKETPERFYGKTVRLFGGVDHVYSDRAFELDGAEWAFNDKIVVLTKTPVRIAGAMLTSDDEVIVTGKVRPFVVAEVEREIGWDIGSDVEIRLSKRPVIIAESIRKVGEPGGVWPAPVVSAPVTNTLMIVTLLEPVSLAGRKVDLGRERVQSVTGKGLWVGPSRMSQVFVVPSQPVKDVKAGDWVKVSGTLQKPPKDAAKAWELPAGMAATASEETVYVDGATVSKVPAATPAPGTATGTTPTPGDMKR